MRWQKNKNMIRFIDTYNKIKIKSSQIKSNKIKIGMNEMRVNNSELSMKQRSLVNTGDISPEK